jgi:hypothetical protein
MYQEKSGNPGQENQFSTTGLGRDEKGVAADRIRSPNVET